MNEPMLGSELQIIGEMVNNGADKQKYSEFCLVGISTEILFHPIKTDLQFIISM